MTQIQDPNRGTGRTTKQMEALPINGVYISCHHAACHYDKNLARMLGRHDIQVVPPSWVTSTQWRGKSFSAVVRDHAYKGMHKDDHIFERFFQELLSRVAP
jgi:hypothetical protein